MRRSLDIFGVSEVVNQNGKRVSEYKKVAILAKCSYKVVLCKVRKIKDSF